MKEKLPVPELRNVFRPAIEAQGEYLSSPPLRRRGFPKWSNRMPQNACHSLSKQSQYPALTGGVSIDSVDAALPRQCL